MVPMETLSAAITLLALTGAFAPLPVKGRMLHMWVNPGSRRKAERGCNRGLETRVAREGSRPTERHQAPPISR